MAKEDEEKTMFITSQGIFCYTKMLFGLRNVGATYQCLVDKVFHKHIGRNLEVYVDDLVIKSRTEDKIVRDIEEAFKTLREINMKLNPKKCTFGVEGGMFLGYKVNTKGAESMSRQGRRCLKSSIPKMLERRTKVKRKARKPEHVLGQISREIIIHSVLWLAASTRNVDKCARPRVLVKGKILADFIVERPEEESLDTLMEVEEELPGPCILFTDGSSCTDGYGAGLILTNPEGMEFTCALRFRFDATNNEAEYKALIAGLRMAEQMGVKNLQANVDSRQVANQVNGTFGLPGEIISDNGKQFQDNPFKDCLGEGIKERLDARSKNWMEELSHVLWAHHTMIKSSNRDTPFSLTYGTKVLIPAEIGMPTLRTVEVDLVQNNEALEINLDLLEEKREQAAIREAKSKAKIEKYYNLKV
ncbi:reverse transcriptase domain-containing protein [Tanacetum coccineum]